MPLRCTSGLSRHSCAGGSEGTSGRQWVNWNWYCVGWRRSRMWETERKDIGHRHVGDLVACVWRRGQHGPGRGRAGEMAAFHEARPPVTLGTQRIAAIGATRSSLAHHPSKYGKTPVSPLGPTHPPLAARLDVSAVAVSCDGLLCSLVDDKLHPCRTRAAFGARLPVGRGARRGNPAPFEGASFSEEYLPGSRRVYFVQEQKEHRRQS